ncbi:MAG: hypothetical protein WDZ37_07300 [Solirubrobacterales bacterium]
MMLSFGLATAIVAKIKGSSFFVWFLVGFFLPIFGLIAALLYRYERFEPKRRCPRCGRIREITDQVCTGCGEELYWPERDAIVRPQ